MFIGNAEIVPFSPRKYLYHAYMAYMRANGLNKPVSLMRFGTDMPVQWLSMARGTKNGKPSTVSGQTLPCMTIQKTGCHHVTATQKTVR
jgi:phage/plasmid-associated DNA primase